MGWFEFRRIACCRLFRFMSRGLSWGIWIVGSRCRRRRCTSGGMVVTPGVIQVGFVLVRVFKRGESREEVPLCAV